MFALGRGGYECEGSDVVTARDVTHDCIAGIGGCGSEAASAQGIGRDCRVLAADGDTVATRLRWDRSQCVWILLVVGLGCEAGEGLECLVNEIKILTGSFKYVFVGWSV